MRDLTNVKVGDPLAVESRYGGGGRIERIERVTEVKKLYVVTDAGSKWTIANGCQSPRDTSRFPINIYAHPATDDDFAALRRSMLVDAMHRESLKGISDADVLALWELYADITARRA